MPIVRYDLEGDASDLDRSLDGAAAAFDNVARRAQKAQGAVGGFERSQKRAAGSSKKLETGLKGLERVATGFQGRIGGAAGVLAAFGEGLRDASALLGPVGTAAAGAGLAVAGMGFAVGGLASKFVELARSAADALDDLDALKIAVPPEIRERVERLDAELNNLKGEAQRVLVAFVGIDDKSGDLVESISTLTSEIADSLETMGKWKAGIDAARSAMVNVVSLGGLGTAAIGKVRGAFEDASDGAQGFTADLEEMAGKGKKATAGLTDDAIDLVAWMDELEARQAAAEKAAEAAAAAEDARVKRNIDGLKKRAEGIRLLQEVERDRVNQAIEFDRLLTEQRFAGAEAIRAQADALVADMERQTEQYTSALEGLHTFVRDGLIASFDNMAVAVDGFLQRGEDRAAASAQAHASEVERLRERRAALREELKHKENISDIDRAITEAAIEGIGRQIDAAKTAQADTEKRALRQAQTAHALSQTAAIGQATINAAVATTALLASPGFAFLGPGAIPAVALAVGALLGTQIAAISSQAPPTVAHDGARIAHDGLARDEVNIRARAGESVLNQRASETTDVDRLNRGQPSEPQRWVLEDAGRVIGEVVLRAIERPGDMRARYRSALGVA